MTVTLTSTTPANGTIKVALTSSINIIVHSDIPGGMLQNTLNVTVQLGQGTPIPAIINGDTQPGYSASINLVTSGSGDTLTVNLIQLAQFGSYEVITIGISIRDTGSALNTSIFFRTLDVVPPTFDNMTPLPNSVNNSTNNPIFFRIQDVGSGVSLSTINIAVTVTTDSGTVLAGNIVNGTIQSGFDPNKTVIHTVANSIDVFLTLLNDFPSGAFINVMAAASDEDNTSTLSFSFRVVDVVPPVISNLIPAPNATNVSESTTITLAYSDPNGVGVNLNTINIAVNTVPVVINGAPQLSYGNITILQPPGSVIIVIAPDSILPTAAPTQVVTSVQDFRGNRTDLTYSFTVRDYLAPQLINIRPGPVDGYSDILPDTNIFFTIAEEPDGYAVDFTSLQILIDGYSVVEGYGDGYFDGYGTFVSPSVVDAYGDVLYRGFTTVITPPSPILTYDVTVTPMIPFDFNATVFVSISVADVGGNKNSISYSFITAPIGTIVTTAIPDTGLFKNYIDGYGLLDGNKFLFETGVQLVTNLPNTTTYYTIDGSMPMIDKYGIVRGTTKVYTGQPILFQQEGLHVLKFFSADEAGNSELVKQEVYLIKILPPELRIDQTVHIVADIPLPTTVIPVDSTALFAVGQTVEVLDDIIPPVFTTILSVNNTTNPQFIIVKDNVSRLKVSRHARVNIVPDIVNPAGAIKFDTSNPPAFMYIGSDGNGQNQADAVLESFRILNVASQDTDILADFTLLSQNTPFFNQTQPVTLSSTFSALEVSRSNIPNNTLVLLNFDGTVANAPRQGTLAVNTVPIVDVQLSSNTVIFIVQVSANQFIDRELLEQVLRNFAPVDLAIQVQYVEVD